MTLDLIWLALWPAGVILFAVFIVPPLKRTFEKPREETKPPIIDAEFTPAEEQLEHIDIYV